MRSLRVVHQRRIFPEQRIVAPPGRLLQQMDGAGIVQMILLPKAGLVRAGGIKRFVHREPKRIKGLRVVALHHLPDLFKPNAANARNGIGKIFVHNVFCNADCLENLRGLIGLHSGNAHFGGDFHNAVQHGGIVSVDGGVRLLIQQALIDQAFNGGVRQIGVDRPCPVAQQRSKMMYIPRLGRFEDHRYRRALAGTHQMLLQRRNRQQRRDRHMVFVHAPVRKNNNIHTVAVCTVHLYIKMVNCAFQTCVLIINNRNNLYLKTLPLHVFNL